MDLEPPENNETKQRSSEGRTTARRFTRNGVVVQGVPRAAGWVDQKMGMK